MVVHIIVKMVRAVDWSLGILFTVSMVHLIHEIQRHVKKEGLTKTTPTLKL